MIGIGVDAVDIERFREVLARRPARHQRLFTDGERALAAGRMDPVPALAEAAGVSAWHLSLTHSDLIAVAVVAAM